jgi:hypothetical protein
MIAAYHSLVTKVMTSHLGELLHMDTVGPARVCSFGGKWYVLVVVDDFSRYSTVFFMMTKDEAFTHARDLILWLQNEFPKNAMRAIRSDNGPEFKNTQFATFCASLGLEHQFSSLYVPQQNGIVEHKNWTLVEMARTMLDEHRTSRHFWAEAINTACHVSNRIFLRAFLNKTSYELRFGRPPKVSHFRVFGCRCFVLKLSNLDKFESRSSDGVFLGYALHSHACRVLNLETNRIMDTCEVTFNETAPCPSHVFEPAGLDQMGQTIFVEEEHDDTDWVALEPTSQPPQSSLLPLLRLTDPTPLLPPLGVRSSQLLLILEELKLLLRGRPLPQGKLHNIFSAVTHLSR